MDKTYALGPHVQHGGQVKAWKGSQTWSEGNMKQKKNPFKESLNVDEGINPL
jgi:hypothetical protein